MEEKVIEELDGTEDIINYNLCARSRMTGEAVYKESELSKEYKDVMRGLKLAYSRVQNDLAWYQEILDNSKDYTIRDMLEAEISFEALDETLESMRGQMIELLYSGLDEQEALN